MKNWTYIAYILAVIMLTGCSKKMIETVENDDLAKETVDPQEVFGRPTTINTDNQPTIVRRRVPPKPRYRYMEYIDSLGNTVKDSMLIPSEYSTDEIITSESSNQILLQPFDIPPPVFQKFKKMKATNIFGGAATFADLDKIMVGILEDAGFHGKYDYFKVDIQGQTGNGFVIVTQFERIDKDGNYIEANRWDLEVNKSAERNWFGMKKIGKGYFRFFAFVFLDNVLSSNTEQPGKNEIFEKYMSSKSTGLPPVLGKQSVNDLLNFYILTYEYFQQSNEVDGSYQPMEHLSIEDHLQNARLSHLIHQP